MRHRPATPWWPGTAAGRQQRPSPPHSLLQQVSRVTLAVFGPGRDDHGDDPGADIALYLARHDVKVEVLVRPHSADAGQAILALANDLDAELLVMGAYGHSRWREMVLGGATRTVLAQAALPVLLSH